MSLCAKRKRLYHTCKFMVAILFIFNYFHLHNLFAKHFLRIRLSPVQRYISVNIIMHAGLQLIIVQMSDDLCMVWSYFILFIPLFV